MVGHAEFLRRAWSGVDGDEVREFVQAFDSLARRRRPRRPADAVVGIKRGLAVLPHVDDTDRVVLAQVVRLTTDPSSVDARSIEELRAAGLGDREIHDLAHVVACFAYMNRVAMATGVTVEPRKHDEIARLVGDEPLRRHLRWASGTAATGR